MPIGPYKTFAECTSAMEGKYGAESAKKVCGAMEAKMKEKSEDGYTFEELPDDAKTTFVSTFADALQKNDESASWKVAWANVRRHYEKTVSGKWVPLKVFDNIEFKSLIKSDRIIYGDASVAMVDTDGEMITEDALKTAFNSYVTRGHVLFYHRNIPIGEVLSSYTTPDGKVLKSGVQDKTLKVVVRVYKDTKKADEVWDAIERGDLRAFSIGGEVIGEPVKVCQDPDCHQSFKRIDRIDLHEISIVPNPANEAAYFSVIKSKVEKVTQNTDNTADDDDDDDYSKAKTKLNQILELSQSDWAKARNCPEYTKQVREIIKGGKMTDKTEKEDFEKMVLAELAELKGLAKQPPVPPKPAASSSSEDDGTKKAPMMPSSSSEDDGQAPKKNKGSKKDGSQEAPKMEKVEYVTKDEFKSLSDKIDALLAKSSPPAAEVKVEEKKAEAPAPKIEVAEKKAVAVPERPLNPLDSIDFSSPMWKAGEFNLDDRDGKAMTKIQDLFAKAKKGV